MSAYAPGFNRGAVRPVDCVRDGWNLVKDRYWTFFGIGAIGLLLGSAVPFGILLGAMMCGIHLANLRHMRGEPVALDTLFKGFDYFGPSLVATLVQVGPLILVLVGAYVGFFVLIFAAAGAGGDPEVAGALVVGFAAVIALVVLAASLVSVLFMFAYPLIVDRGLGGLEACKQSARAVFGNLGGVLGLIVLLFLVGLGGMLLCYVGVYLVMPISLAAIDVAYRQVFPDVGRPYGQTTGGAPPAAYGAPYGYPPPR